MKTVLLLLAASLALAWSATIAPEDGRPPPPRPGDVEQTEITFQNLPGDFTEQKPVDDLRQEIVLPFLVHGEPQEELPPLLSPRGRKPSCTQGSECTRPTPRYGLDEFPPARPTPDNILNICSETRQKTYYGPWNLPQTSFTHLSRQGETLNNFEDHVRQCCQLGPDKRLACSQSVWSEVLSQFCTSEFAVKTRPYRCCKLTGASRKICFQKDAPFPDYRFPFPAVDTKMEAVCTDPRQCPTSQLDLQVGFPPGEPHTVNLKKICRLSKVRASYMKVNLPKELPSSYWNKAKAVTQLEKEFKKCCKKRDLSCAHQRWEESLNQYCEEEFRVKTRPHQCCNEEAGKMRYDCFSRKAPFKLYNREVRMVNMAEITPTTLDFLCGESVLLTKQRNIPALIQNITDSCCKLQDDERIQCADEQKTQFIVTLCDNQAIWKDYKKCCTLPEGEARDNCFDKNYLSSISLATAV